SRETRERVAQLAARAERDEGARFAGAHREVALARERAKERLARGGAADPAERRDDRGPQAYVVEGADERRDRLVRLDPPERGDRVRRAQIEEHLGGAAADRDVGVVEEGGDVGRGVLVPLEAAPDRVGELVAGAALEAAVLALGRDEESAELAGDLRALARDV